MTVKTLSFPLSWKVPQSIVPQPQRPLSLGPQPQLYPHWLSLSQCLSPPHSCAGVFPALRAIDFVPKIPKPSQAPPTPVSPGSWSPDPWTPSLSNSQTGLHALGHVHSQAHIHPGSPTPGCQKALTLPPQEHLGVSAASGRPQGFGPRIPDRKTGRSSCHPKLRRAAPPAVQPHAQPLPQASQLPLCPQERHTAGLLAQWPRPGPGP